MSLGIRISIMLSVAAAAFLVILYLVATQVVQRSFTRVEDEYGTRAAARMQHSVDVRGRDMAVLAKDWAMWDDVYRFVEDRNPAFTEANLTAETFHALKIDVLLIVDLAGNVVEGRGFDRKTNQEVPLSHELVAAVGAGSPLTTFGADQDRLSGVVVVDGRPMMFASSLILTSHNEGPPRGVLLLGRFFDEAEVRRIAETTDLHVVAHPGSVLGGHPSEGAVEVPRELLRGEPIAVRFTSRATMQVYGLLRDVNGRPALLLTAEMPRDASIVGERTTLISVGMMAVACLLMMAGLWGLLRWQVVSRLRALHREIGSISKAGDVSLRVSVQGGDELTDLAVGINGMLARVEASQDALSGANRKLRQTMDDLKRAQEILVNQERLEAVGQLVHGISHDFNNTLVPIVGLSEVLLEDPEARRDGAGLRQALQEIHDASLHARDVVWRLREFCRPAEGKGLIPVDLRAVIDDAVVFTRVKWQAECESHGVTMRIDRDFQPTPPVDGNPTELRQVFGNLILNAVSAMPRGGVIQIRTRLVDNRVVAEVQDSGVGMAPEVRARCFDPFYTTKEGHGTGLGLAIVHGVVARHGGTVGVDSEPGKGTTFTIRLPPSKRERRVEASALSDVPSTVAAGVSGDTLSILIVDDQASIRVLIRRLLERKGHRVDEAESGDAALRRLGEMRFDLVITDRAMAGMNGDELGRRVKAVQPGIPVILLTGFGSMMKELGDHPDGVDLVIGKPVVGADLDRAIAQAMHGGGRI